jgi:branched-chain amino acid transport system permease protein
LRQHWLFSTLSGVAVLGIVLVAAAVWGTHSSRANEDVATFFFVNLIIVLSLQVFSGNSGLLSFGHFAFVALGGYVASLLTLDPTFKQQESPGLPGFMASAHWTLIPATLVAMGVACVVAIVSGLIFFRLSYSSTIIGIFALLLISNAVTGGWTRVTGGGTGIYGMSSYTTVSTALVACLIALLVARLFKDSASGIRLRASREDEPAAVAAGIDIRRLRLGSWVLSAALAAMAGSLLAHRITAISPTVFFLQPTFIVVAMLVIGGLTTVSGAVMGAFVVTAVREFTRPLEEKTLSFGPLHVDTLTGLSQLILVFMILGSMYFRKEGLAGRLELDEHVTRWLRRRSSQGREHAGTDVSSAPDHELSPSRPSND